MEQIDGIFVAVESSGQRQAGGSRNMYRNEPMLLSINNSDRRRCSSCLHGGFRGKEIEEVGSLGGVQIDR
jgi:hypothetical protein